MQIHTNSVKYIQIDTKLVKYTYACSTIFAFHIICILTEFVCFCMYLTEIVFRMRMIHYKKSLNTPYLKNIDCTIGANAFKKFCMYLYVLH